VEYDRVSFQELGEPFGVRKDRGGLGDLEVDQLVPGREVYELVSPSLKAFLQFTHLSCRPKEPSWAALGMSAINLGSRRGLVLIDDKVLDPVSLAKQIETNIGWFWP